MTKLYATESIYFKEIIKLMKVQIYKMHKAKKIYTCNYSIACFKPIAQMDIK